MTNVFLIKIPTVNRHLFMEKLQDSAYHYAPGSVAPDGTYIDICWYMQITMVTGEKIEGVFGLPRDLNSFKEFDYLDIIENHTEIVIECVNPCKDGFSSQLQLK